MRFKCFSCFVVLVLLAGCSDKETLNGDREGILSLEDVGENSFTDSSAVVVDPAIENHAWPQPYLTTSHSYAPLSFSGKFQEIWSAGLDFEGTESLKITSSPVIADGKIFYSDAGGIIYALDAKTGKELWQRSVTIIGKDGQTGTSLAYHKGHLIVGTCFDECFSLNATNGNIDWRIKLPAASKGDAITIYEDKIFLLCANSTLQVIDARNGKLLWSHSGIVSDFSYLGSASVAVDRGVVYVAYPSGEIFALLAENGSNVWESMFPKFSIGNSSHAFTHPKASPVVKDGIVYLVAANEQTAAFDAGTGKRLWIKDFGSVQTPIVTGNSIFVLNNNAELVCLNRFSGAVRWKASLVADSKQYHWYGMTLMQNHILVISPDGNALFVSLKNGKIEKRENLRAAISVNPVICDSTLYILSNDKLSAYK